MTQDGTPADKPEKTEEKKENIYVPSLVDAQAAIAARAATAASIRVETVRRLNTLPP